MSLRDGLIQSLTDNLPADYVVHEHPAVPEYVSGKDVFVYTTDVRHLPQAPKSHLEVSYSVQVVTNLEDISEAEEALDAMVLDLLKAIWNTEMVVLDRAERTTVDDKYHAWTFYVSAGVTINLED